MLSTGSTQEDPSQNDWKIVDWEVKNEIKQAFMIEVCVCDSIELCIVELTRVNCTLQAFS